MTRALLLTDVVDSTRIQQRLGDAAMLEVWATHDRLARDLVERHGGREIDKSDGVLVLFESVDDALAFAEAYHSGLHESGSPFMARVGLHWGPVTLHPNAASDIARGAKAMDVLGLALPIAARVLSVAMGQQTLVTSDAVAAHRGGGRGMQSHGHWQLKGIVEPVELFEVLWPGALFRTPADAAKAYRVRNCNGQWVPARDLPTSVPSERDAFVGRRREIEALSGLLLAGTRLLTVAGIGGAGKTRLVQRFSAGALGGYEGGVWFCDLSQARSVDGVCHAVAQGMRLAALGADPVPQLGEAIRSRGHCLIVLDNFEQVVGCAEATLGTWLDGAPAAQFVVTSREVLGVSGESVLALEPLPVDDASELFALRAAAASVGYRVGTHELPLVRQLVAALDGLPLAIELTAPRTRALSLQALLSRVRDRLELAAAQSGRRDRQATLRAAFDWSWDLLDEPERAALAQLSVFEGGFALEAMAYVVIDASAPSGPEAMTLVQRLLDKSLLRRLADDRFGLLETVREYAASRLVQAHAFGGSGPAAKADVQERHWRYYGSLSESQARAGRCVEADNLVAACVSAAAAQDASWAARALVVAWGALRQVGPYGVALRLSESVLLLRELSASDTVLAHWVAAEALEKLGRATEVWRHVERGLAAARGLGNCAGLVRLRLVEAYRLEQEGEMDRAATALQDALRSAEALGDHALQMLVLNDMGRFADQRAQWGEARMSYERALALARQLDDRRMEGGVLGNLGGLLYDRGELQQARSHFESALACAEMLGDQIWEGNARCNLGLVLQDLGQSALARIHYEAALALAKRIGYQRLEYTVECNLGLLLAQEGDPSEAAARFELAANAASRAADRRSEGQYRGYLAASQARLGHWARARASLATAQRLIEPLADRFSSAMLSCDRAEVYLREGESRAGVEALRCAQQLFDELDCGAESQLGRRIAELVQMAGS